MCHKIPKFESTSVNFGVMTTVIHTIPLVQKEKVDSLRFPRSEVLSDPHLIGQRARNLHYATSLGNLDHHKVQIVFEDAHGIKRVNTTIWAVTNERVILKNNRVIPVHRIHEVVMG